MGQESQFKRKIDWKKAKKKKNNQNKDFVLIPVEYDSKHLIPGIVIHDDETKFKIKLPNLYLQPLIEYLVVYKEKGQENAFLTQLFYDPFLMANEIEINESNLSGLLFCSNWDDTLLDGLYLEKGKAKWGFNTKNINNGKVAYCNAIYINYISAAGPGSCEDPEYIAVYG